jgi:hypothetical protein
MPMPEPKLKHPRAKALWRSITHEYALEDHAIDILAGACIALDRAEAAAEVLEREGLTVPTKNGVRAHPCCSVERDSRNLHSKYMRQLGLDMEDTTRGPGRPPHPVGHAFNGRR